MTVSGIGNRAYMEKIAGSVKKGNREEQKREFGEVAGKLGNKSDECAGEKETKGTKTGSLQLDYHSGRISSLLAVSDTGRIHAESTVECETKHITYAQSDKVKLYAVSGYTLKAQTILDEHKVYIEQKNEDGSVQGYMVNPLKVPEDSTNPVELLAKECWENTREIINDGTFTESDLNNSEDSSETSGGKTLEEALLEFYDFVKERVKNGPPKIQTGGGEFSIEEWDKLMEDMDDTLDAFKEELRERIAKEKDKQLLSSDSEKTALINAADDSGDEEVTEVSAPQRGSSFADMLQGKKKAPYSFLADESGVINYKGVIFHCDDKKQQITLGDMSDEKNVITIPLSKGGCLKVNRDNIGDLAKAIGMFSPEDVNLILRAIAQDNKAREMQMEIDETVNGLGVKKS
ncbi:hypothetical protein AALB52_05665 [Lachnospiraceae bacterium 38-14]|jgi:hypothetical protein|nr:hypothetical protein [Lachnospiraceae bacterium]